jgi:hypothetical protein
MEKKHVLRQKSKQIVELIDLHLRSLVKKETVQMSDDGLEAFDIAESVISIH